MDTQQQKLGELSLTSFSPPPGFGRTMNMAPRKWLPNTHAVNTHSRRHRTAKYQAIARAGFAQIATNAAKRPNCEHKVIVTYTHAHSIHASVHAQLKRAHSGEGLEPRHRPTSTWPLAYIPTSDLQNHVYLRGTLRCWRKEAVTIVQVQIAHMP